MRKIAINTIWITTGHYFSKFKQIRGDKMSCASILSKELVREQPYFVWMQHSEKKNNPNKLYYSFNLNEGLNT